VVGGWWLVVGGWWFRTIGKGNKERSIPVSDALLKALKRYRKTLDLPALPYPHRKKTYLYYQNKEGEEQ
jgi:integrase